MPPSAPIIPPNGHTAGKVQHSRHPETRQPRPSPGPLGALATLALLVSIAAAQHPRSAKPHAAPAPGTNQSLQCSIADGFTLAAVGDLIINQPESNLAAPRFQAALNLLRHADAGFGNFEGTALDIRTFKGYPAAENGGQWLIDSPKVPADLLRMGIDIVSHANNHATDWGVAGMEETDRRLRAAGVVYAGSGRDLGAARAPHYLNTPQGRVGIVAMTSTFTPMSRAMNPLGAAPGRPGINALRTTASVVLPKTLFDQARRLRAAILAGMPKAYRDQLPKSKNPKVLSLFRSRFQLGNRVELSYKMNQHDLKVILKAIRQGKEDSDFLIASIHTHEPGNWSDRPPNFLPTLAHDAINAGADEFISHGPHQLRGIEIYRGKPIFYSLGNFFFQTALSAPVGADLFEAWRMNPATVTDEEQGAALNRKWFSGTLWYQSVIAVSRFEHGEVSEIRLYPVVLGATRRAADRGIPRLATAAQARPILERLQRLSAPYHTTIAIEGAVGVIRPTSGQPGH